MTRPLVATLLATLAATPVMLALTAGDAAAQRRRGGRGFGVAAPEPNAPYDGRFTFVRLRYLEVGPAGWAFDYPQMERNFMTILADLTTLRPHVSESNVLTMDDPDLGRYPIAYLSEPGYWVPTEGEAKGLARWLAKGGFLIVDDFLLDQWVNFERQMQKVIPGVRFFPLDISHPLFNTFFRIGTLDAMHHPQSRGARAQYLGIYEDNDPTRRLIAIVNYNNDIGDYMEWSGDGWYPVNMSNDAYKLATNYLVYAMSR